MFKKLILFSVVAVGACFALKGTKLYSYAKDEIATLCEKAESKIPLEKKLNYLRKEVAALDKEIDKAANELAKEIVETEYLARDIERETAGIASEEKKVRAAAEGIANSTEKVVAYGRLNLPVAEAKQYLADDVQRIVTRKETLSAMKETYASRLRIKDALMKQVDTIKQQKRELSLAIERTEADIKALQLAQMESKYQFDDTKLSKAKQTLKEIQKEVDIKRAKLKLAPTVAGEAGAPSTNLGVDDILAPLDGKAAPRSN